MDINQMVQFHLEHRADITVAARPVPVHAAQGFGIIEVNEKQGAPHIVGFHEKPKQPKPMPGDPEHAFSSMGNYLFNARLLQDILEHDAKTPGSHDFGRDILPCAIGSHRILAYDFFQNRIPGLKPHEEPAYWRDVGTLEAYWQANMDILGESPLFDLGNTQWPILTDNYDAPPSSLIRAHLDNCVVGQGSRICEADIRRSVIGRDITIEQGSLLEECIILDGAVIGAKSRLRRVIVDRFNHIPEGTSIGFEAAADRKRFQVGRAGLVVLPQWHTTAQVSLSQHPALHSSQVIS
jgi:glucose-1-phosphate adenylyltransferase